MSRLLVMTWLWRQEGGRATFKPEHVNIWAAMVRRHCTLPIEIACVTNEAEGIDPSIRIIAPPGFYDDLKTSRWRGGRPSCYRRLAMFRSDAAEIFGAERFVSMDLDCVIGGNIDSILDRPEDFVICGPSQEGPRWLYNGSMMMMDAGARPCVYDDFTPEAAEEASRRFVGSDQAWIAHSLGGGEATWTADHGVVRWNGDRSGPLMFFPGSINPWNALAHPFVGEHYRLDVAKSALILGDKAHVWGDVERAKDQGPFDLIIALPKPARLWNGRLDHVAEDMRHAQLIARMMGADQPVICGA
jgi:hypothetical protein